MARTNPTIPVAEIFGPTLQGEGALAGKPTYFIRVGGCDYACRWCDSSHAVLAESVRGLPKLTPEQIVNQLDDLPDGPQWVTISGGNPGLYDLHELVQALKGPNALHSPNYRIAVETQGTKHWDWMQPNYERPKRGGSRFNGVDLLTVSPKPPSSGMADSTENLHQFLKAHGNFFPEDNLVLKVVVFDDKDYEWAAQIHEMFPDREFFLSVGTAMGGLRGDFVPPAHDGETNRFVQVRRSMENEPSQDTIVHSAWWTPRGLTDDDNSLAARWRWLADKVKNDYRMADVSVFPQLHVLLWGHVRGV